MKMSRLRDTLLGNSRLPPSTRSTSIWVANDSNAYLQHVSSWRRKQSPVLELTGVRHGLFSLLVRAQLASLQCRAPMGRQRAKN